MPATHKPAIPALPFPLILFFLVRIPLLLALPFDGLRGYGDLLHFYNLADIPGLPYLNFWIEFPPGFAFLNEALYALAGGVEHVYTYLFVFLLLLADIGSVVLLTRLERLLYPGNSTPTWRSLGYAALLGGLPYAWWYFDSLTVFFTLLTLYLALSRRSSLAAGLALGAGILIKFFPILLLPALARTQKLQRTIIVGGVALLMTILPTVMLYRLSPEFTSATLTIQSSRGSLETIWALIDGNYRTGGFGPLKDRLDPAMAEVSYRNPPVIHPYFLLLPFGAFGLFLFLKSRLNTPARMIAFYGLTLVIFFLWSPAWSPQWVQHLLPVAFLLLPYSPGLLLTVLLVLVNLLEWPLLLSRGLVYTLPLTILLRLLLMILLGYFFWREAGAPGSRRMIHATPPSAI
jgi:hypothetical protein